MFLRIVIFVYIKEYKLVFESVKGTSLKLYFYMYRRSWWTWDHGGPQQRSPSVWRAATSTTTTVTTTTSARPQTIIPPRLPLPSQTEATVSAPGSPRAAWQRSGTERRAGQGPDVWRPSCDEDSGGTTKPQGDADELIYSLKCGIWQLVFIWISFCL